MSLKNSTPTLSLSAKLVNHVEPSWQERRTFDPILAGAGDFAKDDLSFERSEHYKTKFD